MREIAAFIGLSTLVIVTPGPDTALTIRNTLLGGRRAGLFSALGVISGQLTWVLATSLGLSALILASETGFTAVRVAGALYLVYLGARALQSTLRDEPDETPRRHGLPVARLTSTAAYRQGVVSNLANPKAAVFFTSLLPQFVGGRPSFFALFVLGVAMAAMTLVWLSAYAAAVAKAGDFLGRPRVRRAMEGLLGAALIGLGLRLASEPAL